MMSGMDVKEMTIYSGVMGKTNYLVKVVMISYPVKNAQDELTGGPGADTFDCGNANDVQFRDFNAAEGDYFVNKDPPPDRISTADGSTCEKAEIDILQLYSCHLI